MSGVEGLTAAEEEVASEARAALTQGESRAKPKLYPSNPKGPPLRPTTQGESRQSGWQDIATAPRDGLREAIAVVTEWLAIAETVPYENKTATLRRVPICRTEMDAIRALTAKEQGR